MRGVIITIPYVRSLYMIELPMFVFAVIQHSTVRSHARTNCSEIYAEYSNALPSNNQYRNIDGSGL